MPAARPTSGDANLRAARLLIRLWQAGRLLHESPQLREGDLFRNCYSQPGANPL